MANEQTDLYRKTVYIIWRSRQIGHGIVNDPSPTKICVLAARGAQIRGSERSACWEETCQRKSHRRIFFDACAEHEPWVDSPKPPDWSRPTIDRR